MIEIIQEYWKSLLWTDGYRYTGVAITLWLLISSVVMGGILALFWLLAAFPVINLSSSHLAVHLYFSWDAAVRSATGVLFRDVYAGDSQRHGLPQRVFRSGLNCTVLALTLNTCAYTTEIFAGAIRSVPHGEIEAARAYGFSSFKLYRCIILPSALRIALPAYSNEVILMLHSTALAFTATVPDQIC